jgi:transcriptional regulator with XRE-family HTH domain
MATQHAVKIQELGDLLRYWRQKRGKSQLDLSLDTGISQRHLSFVESGRSVPSRDLLSAVSEALGIPLRERNVLLLASGYAPLYSECEWDTPEVAAVTQAVDRLLLQHEPHPALVLDRYWNVIRTNAAAPQFFGSFIDLEARPRPRNLLHHRTQHCSDDRPLACRANEVTTRDRCDGHGRAAIGRPGHNHGLGPSFF